MNRIPDGSIGFYAKASGIALLLMAVLAGFANWAVLNRLVVENDATKTVSNLLDNEILLRAGFVCFLIVLLLEIVVAWTFYTLFKPISLNLSLLAAWLRLLYTAMFGASLHHIATIMELFDGSPPPADQILLLIQAFHNGWLISLLFFAFHLFILGYLIIRSSGYVPRLIGYLLFLAAVAYAANSLTHFLLLTYDNYQAIFLVIVTIFGTVGELILALWLLVKGVKMQPVR